MNDTFEIGPIRPPNEAYSLLVRVTRNCPWNRCAFCSVYKGTKFELRDATDVQADIRAMARLAARLEGARGTDGSLTIDGVHGALGGAGFSEAVQVARFVASGGRTVFLQDANSLIMPVDDLVRVLECLRESFPAVERVTSYARAHTVTRRKVEDLSRLREAGLDRIHIGLESGSDRVLALVEKGVTAERHVQAGLRVKEAGMELSEYVIPGLGGRALSEDHAVETARVLRAIDPHFIRLRTLAIARGTPLANVRERGEFEELTDVDIVREIEMLLRDLTGIHSTVRSDHILNLLEEVEGRLPDDHERMLGVVRRFLDSDPRERDLFVVGRRLGLLRGLRDLDDPLLREHVARALDEVRRSSSGPIDVGVRRLASRRL